jgi:hypothetical protein
MFVLPLWPVSTHLPDAHSEPVAHVEPGPFPPGFPPALEPAVPDPALPPVAPPAPPLAPADPPVPGNPAVLPPPVPIGPALVPPEPPVVPSEPPVLPSDPPVLPSEPPAPVGSVEPLSEDAPDAQAHPRNIAAAAGTSFTTAEARRGRCIEGSRRGKAGLDAWT